ncbi:MAG: hypothetical protein ABFC77_00285, partial [Thermoguttaceae bacterium]
MAGLWSGERSELLQSPATPDGRLEKGGPSRFPYGLISLTPKENRMTHHEHPNVLEQVLELLAE